MTDFFPQFLRSTKVLGHVGIEGSKYFLSKLLGYQDNTQTAENLKKVLGSLKGPMMKIAQILGTIPDLLPEEQASILRELQASAPPMGESFVKRRMKGELGEHWMEKFEEFNLKPSFAASLGQVHQGVLENGERVALKLQYPDMESAIETDLRHLRVLLKGVTFYQESLNFDDVMIEIEERLREEVDYILESERVDIFQDIFRETEFVKIPQTIKSLSTKRLLCSSWMEGKSIVEFQDVDIEERKLLAQRLFFAWYFPFYKQGVIHADPHFGNYAVSENHDLILYDFGCVRFFENDFVEGVLDLFEGLLNKDINKCLRAYENWGFEGVNSKNVYIFNLWAELLYGPLLEDKIGPLQKDHSGVEGKNRLFFILDSLKNANHKIKIPKEFVFFDRATVGIGSGLLRLKTEQNWHKLFCDLLEKSGRKVSF